MLYFVYFRQQKEGNILNVSLLRYHISKNNMSLKQYAKNIGITYNALYKKMAQRNAFSIEEVRVTISCLNLSEQDVIEIFFNDLFPKVN